MSAVLGASCWCDEDRSATIAVADQAEEEAGFLAVHRLEPQLVDHQQRGPQVLLAPQAVRRCTSIGAYAGRRQMRSAGVSVRALWAGAAENHRPSKFDTTLWITVDLATLGPVFMRVPGSDLAKFSWQHVSVDSLLFLTLLRPLLSCRLNDSHI